MSQHVDRVAAVFERRLRPIYENLEVGNNRKALQETEKLLKKQPNLMCARALKGMALLRLGRFEESQFYLQGVTNEKPIDDSTLQVLSFCYKELHQLDKIVEMYSNAVKQSPGNEELLAHLFMSHVRLEDFKSQQAVALQLYKTHPKNAYYFWAVMSVVLQGVRGPESKIPEKRKIYLSLAQRMVDKLMDGQCLQTEQEIYLYTHILKLQEKYKEAFVFLTKTEPDAPTYMKIELLKILKMWQELNEYLRGLLTTDRDRWDYYKDFLISVFELIKLSLPSAETEKNDVTDKLTALDECHDFLCQLMEADKKKVRGPYLARLELHRIMRDQKLDAKSLLGDFTDLVIEYFHLFGDKSCCTHDITLFLSSISIAERQELAGKLLLESGITSTILPQNKEQMQKHICALQISRICGSHIDLKTEHLLAFYTALKLHYEHGLSSFGNSLLHTDMVPSDAYALLAANVMYDVTLQEQKSDRIFEALCLLQYVLRNTSSNFHVKLLSLKIYHMFGCIAGAQSMYDFLDIKQIQLDSMGYVHCNLLPLCGRFNTTRNIYDLTLKFFTDSYKDRLEYIAMTYRCCTFMKLEEFMNFKKRLTNSIQYVAITIEAQLSDLIMLFGSVQQNLSTFSAMSLEPAVDRILWDELSDNRDLKAIVRWDPVHLIDTEAEREESFKQEVEVIRIRSLMLRMMAAFLDLYHPPNIKAKLSMQNLATPAKNNISSQDENNVKETSTVELLQGEWKTLFSRLREAKYKPLSNRFLANLLPTRLHLLLEVPYEKFFYDLAQLVMDMYNGANNLPLQCKSVCDNVNTMLELCSLTIKESNEAEDNLWNRKACQNKVAASMEILSLYAFIVSVLYEKLQTPAKSKSRKKNNNENNIQSQVVSEKERCQLVVELMRHLKLKFQSCEKLIQSWKGPNLPRHLNSYMADMSIKPEVEAQLISEVSTAFRSSHETMVFEMKNLIKDKIRMISK